eukprot:TRINITY_DN11357_c0_g1_i1.p1 TRINITY_DN11357_c0_g1~~TRINITY_DN11357_c0_g1_i1.p1  ORF type:complete len:629 (-),score=58.13 TRINITY_DN11357_c0_g1_i1:103-1968(-)
MAFQSVEQLSRAECNVTQPVVSNPLTATPSCTTPEIVSEPTIDGPVREPLGSSVLPGRLGLLSAPSSEASTPTLEPIPPTRCLQPPPLHIPRAFINEPIHPSDSDMRRGLYVIAFATTLDSMVVALGPGVYDYWKDELDLTLSQVGMVGTVIRLCTGGLLPLWGWIADRYSRRNLLAFGGLGMAVGCALTAGASYNFATLLCFRGLTGVFVACITPPKFSLLPDLVDPRGRGKVFGIMGIISTVGNICGTVFGSIVGGFSSDHRTWRAAFYITAALCVVFSGFCMAVLKDPPRGWMETKGNEKDEVLSGASDEMSAGRAKEGEPMHRGEAGQTQAYRARTWKEAVAGLRYLVRIPSFHILILSRTFAGMPWAAFTYLVFWLKLIGLSSGAAVSVFAIAAVGLLLGFGIGGKAGDAANRRYPARGRVFLAQIFVMLCVPLLAILIFVVPREQSSMWLFCFVALPAGAILPSSVAAFDFPVVAEVVLPFARSQAHGIIETLATMVASVSTTIVGSLAEDVYGFSTSSSISELSQSERHRGVDALANAVFITAASAWMAELFILCAAARTLPRDKAGTSPEHNQGEGQAHTHRQRRDSAGAGDSSVFLHSTESNRRILDANNAV